MLKYFKTEVMNIYANTESVNKHIW